MRLQIEKLILEIHPDETWLITLIGLVVGIDL
jgi:hypothetical protein